MTTSLRLGRLALVARAREGLLPALDDGELYWFQLQGLKVIDLQGQLLAVHPAYDLQFDAFAPAAVHGKPAERTAWAASQLKLAANGSRTW